MAQLRRDHQRFEELDIQVIIIGPEGPETFRNFWEKKGLPFIGLPDPEQSVLNLYGQEVRLLKLGRMPAQMLIDKSGMLRYVHYARSMADIPANGDIFALIKR